MLKKDVIDYFGTPSKAARAIGLGRAAVSNWKIRVPPLQAARYHKLTNGTLRFDPDEYGRKSA